MAAVSRQTLTERAADAILDQILDDGLRVGDALSPTGELAARLDVSVIVVREALAILAGRGIISRRQGRESVVARPDPEILDSIFRVRTQQDSIGPDEFRQCRAAIELQSASLAAARHTATYRAETLEPLVDTLRTERKLEALIEADRRFHLKVAELSGNDAVILLLSAMNSVLRDSIRGNWENALRKRNRDGLIDTINRHAAIAETIVAGDKRAAVIAMSRHFSYWGPDFGLGDLIESDLASEGVAKPIEGGAAVTAVEVRSSSTSG